MIWGSPAWSAASPEVTHGFPRRLIAEEHAGLLEGNVIVAAKATNMALRRLAIEDVACLVSRTAITGAGLTLAMVINLRYGALRYANCSYRPNYLLKAMSELGVTFDTFEALESNVLSALTCCTSPNNEETDFQVDGEDDNSTQLCTLPQQVQDHFSRASPEISEEEILCPEVWLFSKQTNKLNEPIRK